MAAQLRSNSLKTFKDQQLNVLLNTPSSMLESVSLFVFFVLIEQDLDMTWIYERCMTIVAGPGMCQLCGIKICVPMWLCAAVCNGERTWSTIVSVYKVSNE